MAKNVAKKTTKKRVKKNVERGQAHIQASFKHRNSINCHVFYPPKLTAAQQPRVMHTHIWCISTTNLLNNSKQFTLDSTALWWATSIMWNRSYILNTCYFKTASLKCTNSSFST